MTGVEKAGTSQPEDPKIAVVVIHGMGEQKPMQTLRSFVECAWQRDKDLFRGLKPKGDHSPWDVWSKPDHMSGSAELRRITTARARAPTQEGVIGQRADFFELHWADLTADTTWGDFMQWFRALLWRNPLLGEIPPRVLLVWLLLWLLVLALALSALATVWPAAVRAIGSDPLDGTWLGQLLSWKWWAGVTAGLALFGAAVKAFLTAYFGDVARYVSAAPRNIKVRHEARQRGLKLLDELNASQAYNRIVVVGHSLGSVLAHDLVLLAWSDAVRSIRAAKDSPLHAAITACEKASDELLGAAGYVTEELTFLRDDKGDCCKYRRKPTQSTLPTLLAAFRQSQRALFRELAVTPVEIRGQTRKSAWLISDLVTLGSPLTHAEFLIARNLCELRTAVMMREALRCPPVLEVEAGGRLAFSFRSPKGSDHWQPHHAAAMAAVRWTNIHDASDLVRFWLGDLISGPLSRDFGPGIVDVKVRIARPAGLLSGLMLSRLFTHTLYWADFIRGFQSTEPAPDHVRALREALNFLDDPAVEARLLTRAPMG